MPGADDRIDLVIGADYSKLTGEIRGAGTSISGFTAQAKADFSSIAAADTAASQKIQANTSQTAKGFSNLRQGGIFAFEAVHQKLIETTTEVARLRAEILQTDDQAKLTQLQAQLRRAQAEMTATRTEMRALRMEAKETTEKAGMLGETMGVKLPSGLTRLIGRMPAMQGAMAMAFQAGVVLAVAAAVIQLMDKVGDLAREIGGFGVEARKAYNEALDYNQRMIVKSLELQDKLAAVATVGKEGSAKYAIETRNATESAARWSQRLGTTNLQISQLEEGARKLEFQKISEWPFASIAGTSAKLEDLRAQIERLKHTRDELEAKVIEKPLEGKARTAEELAREREETQKTGEARISTQKDLNDRLIAAQENNIHESLAVGRISLEEEISQLRTSADQKYAIEVNSLRKLRELKVAEGAATGKNVAPEIIAIDEKIAAARITLNERSVVLDSQLRTGQIARIKQVADAEIAADLRVTESKLKETEQQDRFGLAQARSIEQAEAAAAKLIRTETSLFEAQLAAVSGRAKVLVESLPPETRPTAPIGTSEFAKQLEAIKTLRPEIYAQLVEMNAQEIALRNQLSSETIRIEQEKTKKIQELKIRSAEDELAAATRMNDRQLEMALRVDNQRLQHHQVFLGRWQMEEMEALNAWYANELAILKRAETTVAATLGTESEQYKRLKMREEELDQQFALKSQEVNQRIADRWQAITTRMASTFTQTVNSVLTGHEKIGQAAMKLGRDLELYIIDQGIKKVVTTYGMNLLQMLAAHSTFMASILGIQTAGHATQMATAKIEELRNVGAEAGKAGAAGFASVMEALPFPANVAAAPGVAAASAAQTMAYAGFDLGGTVPGARGSAVPVLAHGGETILPTHRGEFTLTPAGTSNTTNHIRLEPHFHQHGSSVDLSTMETQIADMVNRGVRRGQIRAGG